MPGSTMIPRLRRLGMNVQALEPIDDPLALQAGSQGRETFYALFAKTITIRDLPRRWQRVEAALLAEVRGANPCASAIDF